jgi:hypothetical protein
VEQAGSDALQDHWQKQVVKELPSGHETFTKRKVQQAGRALLAAQLCVHQRGHVLTPTHLVGPLYFVSLLGLDLSHAEMTVKLPSSKATFQR